MLEFLRADVSVYQVEMSMFHNVQPISLTFVGKKKSCMNVHVGSYIP